MDSKLVRLVCKAEGITVADIATTGPLDAETINSGLVRLDTKRAPEAQVIKDGVQLTCSHCHEPLWFRDGDGNDFAAMPSSVEVS